MSIEKTFTDIFKQNGWKSEESVSGTGSTKAQTRAIRAAIPGILQELGVSSVLDIPCGDYSWWPSMKGMENISYIGADIVPELIRRNETIYPDVDFRVLNLVSDGLPKTDLVFCRDCLGHLSRWNIERALTSIRLSGATYLMTTTFYDPKWGDFDIKDGDWRPINLGTHFGLGEPLIRVSEECWDNGDTYADKSLGVWKLRP